VHVFSVTDLKHELLYLENLPNAESYERSYMHRDVITHIVATKYVKCYF
jgi:peptidylprolyl isomerase domain and WD repeat-containing protein 1